MRMDPGPSGRNRTPVTGLRLIYPCRIAKFKLNRNAANSRFVPAGEIFSDLMTLYLSTCAVEIASIGNVTVPVEQRSAIDYRFSGASWFPPHLRLGCEICFENPRV